MARKRFKAIGPLSYIGNGKANGKELDESVANDIPHTQCPYCERRSLFDVVSLFAGCGGLSGYKLAGGEVRLAVDNDADAVRTYRRNCPATPVFPGDIAELTVEKCCRLAGIKPGELDVLDGSPRVMVSPLQTAVHGPSQSTVLRVHPSPAWSSASDIHL